MRKVSSSSPILQDSRRDSSSCEDPRASGTGDRLGAGLSTSRKPRPPCPPSGLAAFVPGTLGRWRGAPQTPQSSAQGWARRSRSPRSPRRSPPPAPTPREPQQKARPPVPPSRKAPPPAAPSTPKRPPLRPPAKPAPAHLRVRMQQQLREEQLREEQLREEQLEAVRNRVQELFGEPAPASSEEQEPGQPSEADREPEQPADEAPEQGEEEALQAAQAAALDPGAASQGIRTPPGGGGVFSDAEEDPGQEQALAGPVAGVGDGGGALVVEGFAEKFQKLLEASGRPRESAEGPEIMQLPGVGSVARYRLLAMRRGSAPGPNKWTYVGYHATDVEGALGILSCGGVERLVASPSCVGTRVGASRDPRRLREGPPLRRECCVGVGPSQRWGGLASVGPGWAGRSPRLRWEAASGSRIGIAWAVAASASASGMPLRWSACHRTAEVPTCASFMRRMHLEHGSASSSSPRHASPAWQSLGSSSRGSITTTTNARRSATADTKLSTRSLPLAG